MGKDKALLVRLSADEHALLRMVAERQDRSLASVLRVALSEYSARLGLRLAEEEHLSPEEPRVSPEAPPAQSDPEQEFAPPVGKEERDYTRFCARVARALASAESEGEPLTVPSLRVQLGARNKKAVPKGGFARQDFDEMLTRSSEEGKIRLSPPPRRRSLTAGEKRDALVTARGKILFLVSQPS
jgi:hypothetical protein